jgi:hypothetical protein
MKNKLLILLLILSNPIYSQSKFQLQLSGNGSEQGVAIVENAAGNFVVLSSTVTGSNIDMIISEISASGIWIKSKKIGTSNGETPLSICTTSDGNYIIGGSYNVSFSDYDWTVAKIDTGFNIVWLKHLGWTGGNDYANSIQEISPGRYGISGTLGLNGSAKPSFVIMDDLGNISQEFQQMRGRESSAHLGYWMGGNFAGLQDADLRMAECFLSSPHFPPRCQKPMAGGFPRV